MRLLRYGYMYPLLAHVSINLNWPVWAAVGWSMCASLSYITLMTDVEPKSCRPMSLGRWRRVEKGSLLGKHACGCGPGTPRRAFWKLLWWAVQHLLREGTCGCSRPHPDEIGSGRPTGIYIYTRIYKYIIFMGYHCCVTFSGFCAESDSAQMCMARFLPLLQASLCVVLSWNREYAGSCIIIARD